MTHKFLRPSFSSNDKVALSAGLFLTAAALTIVIDAVLAFPFEWAFNASLVPLAKLPRLTWSEAFAFLILEWLACAGTKGFRFEATLRE